MAFVDDKYTISFRDAQDRENIVYIDLDGYTGSATALTPAEDPLVFSFGNNNDDEYRPLNPTLITLQVIVTDTVVFADVSGDVALSWRARWYRSGAEVWRGYLLTDEIEQPFSLPSILTLRAVCGLKELDGIKWTASAGVDSFVDHASDILSNLVGQVTAIGYASNWHSYSVGGVSGNTLDRYEYNSVALSNPLDATELPVASLALEQTVGRFGAKMCLANGKWRIYQRSLLGSSYSMSTYGGGSETISAFTITNDDIYSDATGSNAPAYSKTDIGYYHYPEEAGFIKNGAFNTWTSGVPDNWTEIGAGGNLTQRGSYGYGTGRDEGSTMSEVVYACAMTDVAFSGGTDYGSEAVINATVGIYQLSAFKARTGANSINLSFDARHTGVSSSNLFIFYSLWLDADSGDDKYWDATTKSWLDDGGDAGTITTPGADAKMPRAVTSDWRSFSIATTSVPEAGYIKIFIYSVVDKGSATSSCEYRSVKLGYSVGDRSDRVKTTTTATNPTSTSGLIRPESFFFMGQGPSANHTGAITFGGGASLAENWKTSGYAILDVSSGNTLEKVHAEEILNARGFATPRIRLTFRRSSGSYWPHAPLSYGGNVYSCVMLSYNSRLDEYQGEWLKVASSGVTIDTKEKYSDEDVRPTDFDFPVYVQRTKIGVVSGGEFKIGESGGIFPRVSGSSSDASSALGSNYFTGDLEISTGAAISFKGGSLTRAITGGNLTWNSNGLVFTYDRADSVTTPSILNLTWDNENGTDTVALGFTATDKGGGVWTTDDWHVSSAVPVLIETTGNNYDITITPHGTGNIVLDYATFPASDAVGYLKSDGSGTLSWATAAELNKCLVSNISDVSVGNTGTETTLISATVRGSKNISANTVQTGSVISIVGRGYFTTKVVGGGSDEIVMRFKVGGVTIMTTGALNLGFDAVAGWWEFTGDATVDNAGATGTVWAQGIFRFYNDDAATYTDAAIVKTAVSSAINFTATATMDFTADWTQGDASNVITCTTLFVDLRHRA